MSVYQISPFLKWAGGKKRVLPELHKYFPTEFDTFYEPFVGAGSVFMDLQPKQLHINDYNGELINTYRTIKNNVEDLIRDIGELKRRNSKEFYLKIRAWDRDETLSSQSNSMRAARMIYMNKVDFNGLYRVNAKGQFNVPYGRYKNPKVFDESNLRNINQYLNDNGAVISNGDFEEIALQAKKGDFVYFDSPYIPVNETSFTTYTDVGFGIDDQKRLANLFAKLDKRGCYVVASNSDVPLISELYQQYEETTHHIKVGRSINSDATKRGGVGEVIITNNK